MDIEQIIRDYIAKNLLFSNDGFQYDDEASFLREGIVDSIGVLELVSFIGDCFHIQVADQDITPENFDSVTRLARYVRSKMSVKA